VRSTGLSVECENVSVVGKRAFRLAERVDEARTTDYPSSVTAWESKS
jgi:hypothetical protein